jgi:hypothetical protein|tara:strand:+ start:1809 stop:2441 length:633 start_codon:yes stop_codon:yes gene_type:complete
MKKYSIKRKNDKKVTFIGVNHKISIENLQMNTLINSNDKILIEENYYLNNNDLIKKLSKEVTDQTTKYIFQKLVFSDQLNRISGWDPRPSFINSTGLYGADENDVPFFFTKYTLQEVYLGFVRHVQNEKIKYKYFYNQKVDIDDKLINLIKKKKITKKFAEKLHNDLRKDHADYADDFAAKTVLPKYQNQNVTLIVGLFHFNNLINKVKL